MPSMAQHTVTFIVLVVPCQPPICPRKYRPRQHLTTMPMAPRETLLCRMFIHKTTAGDIMLSVNQPRQGGIPEREKWAQSGDASHSSELPSVTPIQSLEINCLFAHSEVHLGTIGRPPQRRDVRHHPA